MKNQFTREYLAYCKAHGNSPDLQGEIDRKKYPGGCMAGFICWMSTQLAAFHRAHPEAYIGRFISDHDAKCRFLESLTP